MRLRVLSWAGFPGAAPDYLQKSERHRERERDSDSDSEKKRGSKHARMTERVEGDLPTKRALS